MTRPLEYKNAIVTGASSGLGRHFSLTLAKAGAKVAVAARRLDRLKELVSEIELFDGKALPIALDVTDPASVARAVETVEINLGPLHILVNNAGITQPKMAIDVTEEDWDAVVGTNLRGAWRMAQQTARNMKRLGNGGSIINIGYTGINSLAASKRATAYSISKTGLYILNTSYAEALSDKNIRVNMISPGHLENSIDLPKDIKTSIPLGRSGTSKDIINMVDFIISSKANYITGQNIEVSGGYMLSLNLNDN